MSKSLASGESLQLEAGGLVLAKANVDAGATEQIVARSYRHPALADRPVVRLASDRLGQAEDLAMEFLGFAAPAVSAPLARQQRRSLGFAAWALINDPANARFALDLVKRMKAAARQARSKPGHAWDAYTAMAKELGRSARHFLPPFWEEAGRTFKDLGNQTYAGRALNKSLEAERVHALESDRARRRDVVLEFVLSGCLAGSALSEYGNDLQGHYAPDEAFAIFRDLCVRRTRGGMSPWAALPKDFSKLAKAAGLNGDEELEKWLEEVMDAPAMGRPPIQFWKMCSGHCQRIVARNPAFAVALLRHTRPEPRYYGESKLGPWFELLDEWGVFEFLWEEGHRGAPPLGEPVAEWFGRIVRDEVPAPKRTLDMLQQLAPRLKEENEPLPLAVGQRYGAGEIDIDVLEACYALGVKVADPPPNCTVTFAGWLAANVDHPLRNQDMVESAQDERFRAAMAQGLNEALQCRGGPMQRGYRQTDLEQRAFSLAAGDRPGIKALWHAHTSNIIAVLERSALASFEDALERLSSTLWPDTLHLFPDLDERLKAIDTVAMLQRTLQGGLFDEYGLPALEQAVDQHNVKIEVDPYGTSNLHLTFPSMVVSDNVHAHVIGSDGQVRKKELRLPKKCEIRGIGVVGDDLAVQYRDQKYQGHLYWVSNPAQSYELAGYGGGSDAVATSLPDGSVFWGERSVRPGDKQLPQWQPYLHDGQRFWRLSNEYDHRTEEQHWKIAEVDPQTGKKTRDSVPAWFEETEGGTIEFGASELHWTPPGAESSPLGAKDGLLGWKTVKRRDGSYFGVGIDGRRWDKPLLEFGGSPETPVGLLRQPGSEAYLPVSTNGGRDGRYSLWDPTGSTVLATLVDSEPGYAHGQVRLLPMQFWHLLKPRDEASSRTLRNLSRDECRPLLEAATKDRSLQKGSRRGSGKAAENPLDALLPAVNKLLPSAPERMVLGAARVIERAGAEIAKFNALRDKMVADAKKGTPSGAVVVHRKCDQAAAHWGLESIYTYDDADSLSAHLVVATEYLKGNSSGGDLPRTSFHWFPMLDDLPLRCWQTYWRVLAAKMAQKDKSEVVWLEFLKLWLDLGIAQLPGQLDLMDGYPEGAKKKGWGGYDLEITNGASFTIENGDDRFIVVEEESYNREQLPYHFLRYSTAKTPGAPPGYRVKNVRRIKARCEPAQVAAFIAAVESASALPLPSKEELAETAERLSVSPAEIGLVWLGGLNIDSYQNNFLPAELRSALGWKTTEANAGRQALRNLNAAVLSHLYEAIVAHGCAAPFAADRTPVLRALEKTWLEKMPKRLPLDAALQSRLAALDRTSRWHRPDLAEFLAVAADPARLLQPREIEIKISKEQNYSALTLAAKRKNEQPIEADTLQSIVRLVAVIHGETPAGHPARAVMPALIKQTKKLLDHAGTLFELRAVYLQEYGRRKPPTPTEWLNKHVGKTKADAKDKSARIDDGLVVAAGMDSEHQALIAFRTAKLKDKADLARLHGILGAGAGRADDDDESGGGDVLPIVVAIKSPGFQKLATSILLQGMPDGAWPQNPRHTAPAVVKAILKKHKLSEDAAVLYAQVLALPDPTKANLLAWNNWTAAQLKKPSAELVGRKLVLEATRARAGRSIFLPGEWSELKAPWLPIETWKLPHLLELDLDLREPSPAGGPLVLRPFDDLFAAAWKRVVAGDAPRYEEAKRRGRKR